MSDHCYGVLMEDTPAAAMGTLVCVDPRETDLARLSVMVSDPEQPLRRWRASIMTVFFVAPDAGTLAPIVALGEAVDSRNEAAVVRACGVLHEAIRARIATNPVIVLTGDRMAQFFATLLVSGLTNRFVALRDGTPAKTASEIVALSSHHVFPERAP